MFEVGAGVELARYPFDAKRSAAFVANVSGSRGQELVSADICATSVIFSESPQM